MIVLPFVVPPLAPFYAEVHYRFRYFFSLLNAPEPEILADAPHRLEPGEPLPVLVLVKDADRHPVMLHGVTARVSDGVSTREVSLLRSSVKIAEHWWWTIVDVPIDDLSGWISCIVQFDYDAGRGARRAFSDNYRTSSHAPLRVYVSPEPLPSLPQLMLGEGHAHSTATEDQVEFGVPPGAARGLARRMGLQFATMTDHSYDLDDAASSYLVNDPDLPKWHALQREIAELNRQPGFSLIPGEEVSCRNEAGQNIHCLVLGDRQFHPGSGDSAERWLRTRSELSLRELLDRVDPSAIVAGAHPREHVPLIQRWLLRRGSWSQKDEGQPGLHALQFWNGSFDERCKAGRDAWAQQLLRGRRIAVLAGNDAHGNFNRFRQLSIPFVRLREADHQLFGRVRTGLFAESSALPALLEAIRLHRSIATDGPVAMVSDIDGRQVIGSTLKAPTTLRLIARTSDEFGRLHRIELKRGIIGSAAEETLQVWESPGEMYWAWRYDVTDHRPHYLRLEIATHPGHRDQRPHHCLTSPVWFNA
ncbi:MAG: hypothetical protein MUE68_00325 [Bacteroidetes bacterium]|nr:hypothetical protein [Bacteroidota bacterium]